MEIQKVYPVPKLTPREKAKQEQQKKHKPKPGERRPTGDDNDDGIDTYA